MFVFLNVLNSLHAFGDLQIDLQTVEPRNEIFILSLIIIITVLLLFSLMILITQVSHALVK